VHPLIDRKEAAHAEEDQGDDEGPEIDLLAITEGVFDIAFFLRRLQPPEEQPLVAAVGVGVDRFSEHGAGAGHYRRDGFGDGDAEVGQQGEENGFD